MYASNVLKVLYSPRKTLREVIKNPKYIGALLVFILFIGVSIASEYVFLSKYYSEQIVPNGAKTTILDQWTENSAYWTSPNANITTSNDALNGSIYGNMSIAFSAQNSQQVSMQLTNIGTVNCSAPNSYDLLSFRTKWTNPQTQPENVTIRIFSLNSSSDYFINDLTGTFSNSTYNIWNNITIQLDSQAWTSNGNADWGSVTGLQLQFKWASDFNMSILIDGLFFHGPYQSFFETAGSSYLLEYGISAAFQFVIIWVLLTGLIYAFVKLSKGKITWRPAFIAVGFVLMTMFIEILIVTIAFSTLPTIRVPFAALGGVQGEGTAAINTISSEIGLINVINFVGQLIFWVWASGLSSIIVRATAEFSRSKSIVIAGVACSISVLLMLIGII